MVTYGDPNNLQITYPECRMILYQTSEGPSLHRLCNGKCWSCWFLSRSGFKFLLSSHAQPVYITPRIFVRGKQSSVEILSSLKAFTTNVHTTPCSEVHITHRAELLPRNSDVQFFTASTFKSVLPC